MVFQPWMLAAAPAEILLHDAVHDSRVTGLEIERDGQCDITLLMERAGVVAEVHVVAVDSDPPAIVSKQLPRFEHLCNEHGAFARRSGRQKMEILPDRSADGARNSNV